MKWFERTATAMDRFQSRRSWAAVTVAVWRKFYDDQAGYLAALICYFGFVALFPLLLIFVTILDITLKNHPDLHRDLLNSALAQYPVIGDQISHNLGTVSGTGFQLGIGIAVLLLGTRGVAFAMQNALCQVWGISRPERPSFVRRMLYGLALVVAIGTGLVVTSFLSGIAGGAGHFVSGFGAHIGAVAISLTLNVGVFWLSFRLATMTMVAWRNLLRGAMLAALVWQVLQVAGGYVVTHSLNRASTLYGTFGVVLGLLGWLYLQATVTLFCAEVDAVLAGGRWPRSLLSADGAPPEGAIRPRGAAPYVAVQHAVVRHGAAPDGTARDETVPAETRPAETGSAETVPAGPVPDRARDDPVQGSTVQGSTVLGSTVPGNTVPGTTVSRIPAQAAPVKAAHQDRAEAASDDGGRAGNRQDDSHENGVASRDAGEDGARKSGSGQGTSAA
jgi:YihY family inner membrane protein